jgi:hypothetical protein
MAVNPAPSSPQKQANSACYDFSRNPRLGLGGRMDAGRRD